MPRRFRSLLFGLVASLSISPSLAGQEWLGGLATGTIGGLLVGAGTVSTKAILFDRPPYGVSEGLDLALKFTAGGALVGTTIGLAAPERTAHFARNAALGTLVGGLVGLGLGYVFEPERPLGVMTIGIGVGIIGGTLLALLEEDQGMSIAASRPVEVVLLKFGF